MKAAILSSIQFSQKLWNEELAEISVDRLKRFEARGANHYECGWRDSNPRGQLGKLKS